MKRSFIPAPHALDVPKVTNRRWENGWFRNLCAFSNEGEGQSEADGFTLKYRFIGAESTGVVVVLVSMTALNDTIKTIVSNGMNRTTDVPANVFIGAGVLL